MSIKYNLGHLRVYLEQYIYVKSLTGVNIVSFIDK